MHSAEQAKVKALQVMNAVKVGLDCERSSMLLVDDVAAQLCLVCTDSDAAGCAHMRKVDPYEEGSHP